MSAPDVYVGMDVYKASISVAVADAGRNGEIRRYGEIANTPDAVAKLVRKISTRHRIAEYCYEAGPCGDVLFRQLTALGMTCRVVAPGRTPHAPTDRMKNDTRDAEKLARLARAGELTYVWVPDPVHEAMRDLVRARYIAARDVRNARAHIQMFLLRIGIRFDGKNWTGRHRIWLSDRQFEHAGQQIACQSFLNRVEQAEARKTQPETQIAGLCSAWSLAPVVVALQALKGVGLVIAATLAAEIGDVARFETPRHLMAWLGLVPGEHSSGGSIRQRDKRCAVHTGLT